MLIRYGYLNILKLSIIGGFILKFLLKIVEIFYSLFFWLGVVLFILFGLGIWKIKKNKKIDNNK